MSRIFLAIAGYVVAIPVVIYLFVFVHRTLDSICVRHARRLCARHGLEICRVKTESTLVQLDCFDAQKQRRLVAILVWPFGVRKMISDEKYPESYDEQWPTKSA